MTEEMIQRTHHHARTGRQHGLKPDEYERILKLIGREPKFTELGIFSAMWNEHCSYKSSRIHLARCRPRRAG